MKTKILVIDDDDDFRDLARMIFEDHGIDMAEAEDGETGLEMIAANKPDLVLLDILLPNMDGQEVLKRLKENPATKEIPVVVCSTTFHEEARVRRTKQMGAADYIRKPIPADQLAKRVEKVLGKKLT